MVKVKLQPASQLVLKLGLDAKGDVQRFFTNTCALHMDKYVPFDTGTLAETAVIDGNTINTKNVFDNAIVYVTEYAKYVYYGISRSGKPLNYQQDKHPQATRYWDQAMWTADSKQVVREVQNYLNKRGR